jgi:hypothetical protein
LAVLALGTAHAQSFQLNGRFGYLNEYELSAEIAAQPAEDKPQYSGPMIVKHVGICTHDGPDQLSGQINVQFADARSRIDATLWFGGHRCTFRGTLSETNTGELICPGAARRADLPGRSNAGQHVVERQIITPAT